MTTKTLNRIDPLQAGKIAGAIYGLMSLIFVPFFLLFALAGMFIPQNAGVQTAFPAMAGGILFLVFAIMMPILYGAMGFIFGLISAWLYNIVAKWIGGLKFEVE